MKLPWKTALIHEHGSPCGTQRMFVTLILRWLGLRHVCLEQTMPAVFGPSFSSARI